MATSRGIISSFMTFSIYTGLIDFVNKEVANLVLGSESMAGGMQSYVGSTKAHQDIFRDRIVVYRRYT